MIRLSDGDGDEGSTDEIRSGGTEAEGVTLLYGTAGGTTALVAKSRPVDLQQDQLLPDEVSQSSSEDPLLPLDTPHLLGWWHHEKVRNNWKVVLFSLLLTIVGMCLLIIGTVVQVSKSAAVQSYVFFGSAAFCLIPGVYHLIYIYCAAKGNTGYSFYSIPGFK